MPPGLMCTRIFQFDGGHRQAIDRQNDVGGEVVAGMAGYLSRHGELVLRIQFQHIGRERMGRFEISQPEQLAVKLEAVAQHMQSALDVQLLAQRIQQHGMQVTVVLRGFDESKHPCRKQCSRLVPLGVGAGQPATLPERRLFRWWCSSYLCLPVFCGLIRRCTTEYLGEQIEFFIDFCGNGRR